MSMGQIGPPCWYHRRLLGRTGAECFPQLRALDSVQFPLRRINSWKFEPWTEIVMLHWEEKNFVGAWADRLRCADAGGAPAKPGGRPRLRRCRPTDAAMRMQGPSCIRPLGAVAAVAELLSAHECARLDARLASNASERARKHPRAMQLADIEAMRLRREHSLRPDVSVEAD